MKYGPQYLAERLFSAWIENEGEYGGDVDVGVVNREKRLASRLG